MRAYFFLLALALVSHSQAVAKKPASTDRLETVAESWAQGKFHPVSLFMGTASGELHFPVTERISIGPTASITAPLGFGGLFGLDGTLGGSIGLASDVTLSGSREAKRFALHGETELGASRFSLEGGYARTRQWSLDVGAFYEQSLIEKRGISFQIGGAVRYSRVSTDADKAQVKSSFVRYLMGPDVVLPHLYLTIGFLL